VEGGRKEAIKRGEVGWKEAKMGEGKERDNRGKGTQKEECY